MKHEQTWGWTEIVTAAGETDAALRRKVQREQVRLEVKSDGGRTRGNLWDIAQLRVARHLCDVGFETNQSFRLATFAVAHAYKALKSGKDFFGAHSGERQVLHYLAAPRVTSKDLGGVRIISIDPADPSQGQKELLLVVSDPRNVVIPVHNLVRAAWYALPNLPNDVADWLRTSGAKMKELGL